MPSNDEPRIKRSVRPEIEERLPPHLDEEHYEIVHHEASRDRTGVGERSGRGHRQRGYLPTSAYFYVCIALVAILAVETIALGYIVTKKGELESEIEQLKEKNENLFKEGTKNEEESGDDSKFLEQGQKSKRSLEEFSEFFEVSLSNIIDNSGQVKTIEISITLPSEDNFRKFNINSEELSITIILKSSDLSEEIYSKTGFLPGEVIDVSFLLKSDQPWIEIVIHYKGERVEIYSSQV